MNRYHICQMLLALGMLASPVGAAADQQTILPDMPKLEFAETPEIAASYDKYFYFHRDGAGLEEAQQDIQECDALSSGSSIYLGGNDAMQSQMIAQYGGLAGGVGGAIGAMAADAIFGSAARRQQYRINMRRCMGWKGYQRYGLSRELWEVFHFEEGLGRKKEEVRIAALTRQAMVASGPKPKSKELDQ